MSATYALRKAIVASALQDQLEAARGAAAIGALGIGVYPISLAPPGFVGPIRHYLYMLAPPDFENALSYLRRRPGRKRLPLEAIRTR